MIELLLLVVVPPMNHLSFFLFLHHRSHGTPTAATAACPLHLVS